MIWYLVDNVHLIYLLLALMLLGVGLLFWQTKRVRDLLAMGIIVAVGVLVWYLTSLVMTDRKQVRVNIDRLAQAALDRKADDITHLLASDFQFQGVTKAEVGEFIKKNAEHYDVRNFYISNFNVDKFSREKDKGRADVSFSLRVDHADTSSPFSCQAVFVIEGGQWLLKSISLSNPFVGTDIPLVK